MGRGQPAERRRRRRASCRRQQCPVGRRSRRVAEHSRRSSMPSRPCRAGRAHRRWPAAREAAAAVRRIGRRRGRRAAGRADQPPAPLAAPADTEHRTRRRRPAEHLPGRSARSRAATAWPRSTRWRPARRRGRAHHAAPRVPHAQGQLAHGRAERIRRSRAGRFEQVLNTWLADQKPATTTCARCRARRCTAFGRWVEDIAARRDGGWKAAMFRGPADALRTEGRAGAPSQLPEHRGAGRRRPKCRRSRPMRRLRRVDAPMPATSLERRSPSRSSVRPRSAVAAESRAAPRRRAPRAASTSAVELDAHDFGDRVAAVPTSTSSLRAAEPPPAAAEVSSFGATQVIRGQADVAELAARPSCRPIDAGRADFDVDPSRQPRRSPTAGARNHRRSISAASSAIAAAAGCRDRGSTRRPRSRRARRPGQGHRLAAHRHPALQRLPQRSRRVVAPARHRSGRVGAGTEPAGARFGRRPGACAGGQLRHGGLPRAVGHCARARRRAAAHRRCWPTARRSTARPSSKPPRKSAACCTSSPPAS